jgi:hypothetical protein
MSDVQAGALYQEIGTGTLYDVLDVRGATVRIRRTESPYSELELPCERFRDRYAIADSA